MRTALRLACALVAAAAPASAQDPGGWGTVAPTFARFDARAAANGWSVRPVRASGPFGIRLVADELDGDQTRAAPLRRAYQPPDVFRTPNPTPLEGVPAPGEAGRPRAEHGAAPSAPRPAPLPPFAPLVNVRFTDTWLPAAKDDLGMNDFDLKGTLAAGTTGIMLTPGFGMHFLNGPTQTDLPETLYDFYLDARFSRKLDDCWAIELAITPSFYGDFDNNSSDAWRFITTAIAYYSIDKGRQLMAGVMYLDRFDINWFPLFGYLWTSDDGDGDVRLEFVFPRPKFSRRVLRCPDRDGWAYVAGEFGGGAWAVQRQTGEDDMVAIRDWRVVLGYELKVKEYAAPSWYGELGWVFNRQVEYRSGRGDFDPSGAGMLRLGVWY